MDEDGYLENTGWLGVDSVSGLVEDGFLVIELDAVGTQGYGEVDSADEIVFTRHAPGTTSDLEALSLAFDDNLGGTGDDILDQNDSRWLDFRVWKDLDLDGETDLGELQTLAEAGVTSINLSGVPNVPTPGSEPGPYDNVISAYSSFTRADGSTASAAGRHGGRASGRGKRAGVSVTQRGGGLFCC